MANKQMKGRKPQSNKDGLRTTIREELTVGTPTGIDNTAVSATIAANGNAWSGTYVLSAAGLKSAYLSGTSFIAGGNVDPPHLRKLFNLAIDFKYYRVLSGKLIFVPNYGSTQSGQIIMSSSKDIGDASQTAQAAYSSSANYRTFNLSQVNKDIAIPLDVDSSWKKVTSALSLPGQTAPFNGTAGAATIIPVNTVNDLCFTGISMTVTNPNTVASPVNYGVFMVSYEVEFKGLIDSAVNA